jgi:hypothetical protein
MCGVERHNEVNYTRYNLPFATQTSKIINRICLANRAVLVTRNVKHFKQFPDLNVENRVD